MNVPVEEGVPLIVIKLEAQLAVKPGGNPVAAPIPVAPVVEWVIFVITELTHSAEVEEAAPAELTGLTVIILEVVAVQPLALVAVTVYVVVDCGLTTIEVVVEPPLHI